MPLENEGPASPLLETALKVLNLQVIIIVTRWILLNLIDTWHKIQLWFYWFLLCVCVVLAQVRLPGSLCSSLFFVLPAAPAVRQWRRCLRCGKQWRPPSRSKFHTRFHFLGPMALGPQGRWQLPVDAYFLMPLNFPFWTWDIVMVVHNHKP